MTQERTALESFRAPEQYEAYLSEHYKRVFFSSDGSSDVGACLQAARRAHVNDRPSIIHLEAIPGSGKTRLASIVMNYLRLDPTARIHLLHWDAIEEELKDATRRKEYKEYVRKRLLNPGSPYQNEYRALYYELVQIGSSVPVPEGDAPYDNAFLKIINHTFRLREAELIKRSEPNTWIVVDKPGGTGIKYGHHWLRTREYGVEDVDDLVNERGVFQGIDRNKYHLTTIGLVPSPWQQVGFTMYRRLLNNANTLREANAWNRVFGLEPFFSEEAFERARGGGTKLQIEHANDMASEVIGLTLRAKGILRNYVDIAYPSFIREIFEGKEPEILEGDYIGESMMEMAKQLSEIFGEPLMSVLRLMSIGLGSGRTLENTFNIGNGAEVRGDFYYEDYKPDNYIIAFNDPEPFYVIAGILQRFRR